MVSSTRPRFAVVSLVVLVALLVGSAYAVGRTFSPAATTVTRANKAAQRIAVITEGSGASTDVAGAVTIPGATTRMTIPAGQTGILVARFSGQSHCSGDAGKICMIRIRHSPKDANTWTTFNGGSSAGGSWRTFDSSENSSDWESHAAEFVTGKLTAGTYDIRAEYSVNLAGPTFGLSAWTFVVEYWRKT